MLTDLVKREWIASQVNKTTGSGQIIVAEHTICPCEGTLFIIKGPALIEELILQHRKCHCSLPCTQGMVSSCLVILALKVSLVLQKASAYLGFVEPLHGRSWHRWAWQGCRAMIAGRVVVVVPPLPLFRWCLWRCTSALMRLARLLRILCRTSRGGDGSRLGQRRKRLSLRSTSVAIGVGRFGQ